MQRERFEKKLRNVSDKLVLMCRHIESAIENCIKLLVERDLDLVHEVQKDHKRIDKLERKIERNCMKLLVMEQPVAGDFRKISATMKMITDLERIGDQAWDIAEITTQFGEKCYMQELDKIPLMARIVIQMVRDGVQAYINNDLKLARALEAADDKVDDLFKTIMADVIALIKKDQDNAEHAIMLMMITKYLERIGDHAVNIGEWVEYAITGTHPKME